MIQLRVEHHKTFIEEASREELASVRKLLRIYNPLFNPPPGSPPFEVINLFYKEDKSFPSGYLNTVLSKGAKQGLEFDVKDKRTYPRPYIYYKGNPEAEELWETQVEALDGIKKHNLGTVSSATGTGKTRLIEETILHRGVKTLVIVPYRLIQNQMYYRLINTFGKKNVSVKIPKADPLTGKTQPEQTYQKIGGNYKDLYDNQTSESGNVSHGKKLGSSYTIDVKPDVPKKKLGGSYGKEFFGEQEESPEDQYFKKKGIDKKVDLKTLI